MDGDGRAMHLFGDVLGFLLVAVCTLGRVLPDLEPGLDRHTASVVSNIIREGFFVVRQKYFE